VRLIGHVNTYDRQRFWGISALPLKSVDFQRHSAPFQQTLASPAICLLDIKIILETPGDMAASSLVPDLLIL
jgi:hypothetical protein